MDLGWLWCVNVDSNVPRFIKCTNVCTTNAPLWWGMVIMEEAVHGWHGVYKKISVSSSQFCCEPTTALSIDNFVKSGGFKKWIYPFRNMVFLSIYSGLPLRLSVKFCSCLPYKACIFFLRLIFKVFFLS